MEEVERGWLLGPLAPDTVSVDRPLSRRFGLKQRSDKVRLIDGYIESGVNLAVTTPEPPTLHTIDVACATLLVSFSMCRDASADSALMVRTFDLASAYRQVGLSEKGQQFAFTIWCCVKCPLLFTACKGSVVDWGGRLPHYLDFIL